MPTLNELKTALKAALAEDVEMGVKDIGKILSSDSPKFDGFIHQKGRFNSNKKSRRKIRLWELQADSDIAARMSCINSS